MTYSQITDGDESKFESSKAYNAQDSDAESLDTHSSPRVAQVFGPTERVRKRKQEDTDLYDFRRVRIYDKPLGYMKEEPHLGYEEQKMKLPPRKLPRRMNSNDILPEDPYLPIIQATPLPWPHPIVERSFSEKVVRYGDVVGDVVGDGRMWPPPRMVVNSMGVPRLTLAEMWPAMSQEG